MSTTSLLINLSVVVLLLCGGTWAYKGEDPKGFCGSTDAAMVKRCNVNGVCHSWMDSTNNQATYRGTWINNLVFLHEQSESTGDVSFVKSMKFTSPSLVGIESCASDFLEAGTKIKSGTTTKHVKFTLEDVYAYDSNSSASVEMYMPNVLVGDNPTASQCKLQGKSFGIDKFGPRDSIDVMYSLAGKGEVITKLKYQVAAFDTTIDAINLEGGTDDNPGPELVKVLPAKVVKGGDFKFTAGVMVSPSQFSFADNVTHVRFRFSMTQHYFDTEKDKVEYKTSNGELSEATFTASKAPGSNSSSTFTIKFSNAFQYGEYNPQGTSSWSGTQAVASVKLGDNKSYVYVDLPVSADMKTQLNSATLSNFLVLYDPQVIATETGNTDTGLLSGSPLPCLGFVAALSAAVHLLF